MKKLKDKVAIICDNSSCEMKEDLLRELRTHYNEFNTNAMSDYQLYLQGQKEMLSQVISFIEDNC